MYSVNWVTKVITIPKSDLTLDSGTLYRLDTRDFHEEIRRLEYELTEGLWAEQVLEHIPGVTISGVPYAPFNIIINGYSIEFENGLYTVIVEGSNNNIGDVAAGILVQNSVQVLTTNSAGLIKVTTGSGITAQDKTDIINGVWNENVNDHQTADTTGKTLLDAKKKANLAASLSA